jgi:aminopeptidase N
MNRLIAFPLFILISFSGTVSAQKPDSIRKLPPLQMPRSPKTDVQHIALDLHFDWQKKQAIGTATISFVPLSPTNKVTFDAGMLTINSVKLANGGSLKYEYDGGDRNDGLAITLDRIYPAGKTMTVIIDYHTNWVNPTDPGNLWGSYGKGIRFFEPTTTEPRKRRQIWSMGEPEYNRYWFPGYDAPNDFRTTEFTATVDKPLMAISNGRLVETKDNTDGTRTFHWKMDVPHANHQTSFIVGEYVDVLKKYENINLHSYSYPDEIEGTDASTARLPDMVKYYSKMTGMKYPYPEYTQVFVQEFPWTGGHNIGLTTMSDNMVDDYATHADFFYLWDGVESNDLAAQWFANLLTPKDWSHAWLSKSFARYFDCLYDEYKNGLDEFQIWDRQADQGAYFGDWGSGVIRPIVTQNYTTHETMTRDNYALSRGPLVLHMLRKQLGEENWWKAIRYYVKTYAGKSVTTEDLRKAVETVTGTSMKWFFDQWVYKIGHPVFLVSQTYDQAKKQLIFTVTQTQKTDPKNAYPQADFFGGKMEIGIDNRIQTINIKPQTENVFVFNSAQQPKLVNFDYGSAWIKEMTFEKPFEDLLYQFQNDKDVLGRDWALNELVKINNNEKTTAGDKAKIYAACRNMVLGKTYWRFRNNVMAQLQGMLRQGKRGTDVPLDEPTVNMLLSVIKNEKSLNRSSAINFLGITGDAKHAPLYISYLNDESERVVNTAANALGSSKSPLAFDALVKLIKKPSWKNQSLISSLDGLKNLADPRGLEIALAALKDSPAAARWTLATPRWDFRIAAARVLATLGKGNEGYPIVLERFKKSVEENDVNDMFGNVLLVSTLGDPRGQEVFDQMKTKFKDNVPAMNALNGYETQFKRAIKK